MGGSATGKQIDLDIYIILAIKVAGAEGSAGGRIPRVSVAQGLSLPG